MSVLFFVSRVGMLSASGLLIGLTGFRRHLVGLTGLVSLLRLAGLIQLFHDTSPRQQAPLRADQRVLTFR
jgi:hypothetical protein